jgi:SAM-dependent methyltransferase
MIGIRSEYARMFDAERQMWWYKFLHNQTLTAIQNQFGNDTSVSILDAGCGTGGMLDFLQEKGYKNIVGFDLSEDGIDFAQSRGLDVSIGDLQKIASYYPNRTFDVVICNDVVAFFSDTEIINIFRDIHQKLNSKGLFISNNAALHALRGTHDLVLRVPRRFRKSEFVMYAQHSRFVPTLNYWSALLTPLIWVVRVFQRATIALRVVKIENLTSDVGVPSPLVNTLLYKIVNLERKILGLSAPFGSSVFGIFRVLP